MHSTWALVISSEWDTHQVWGPLWLLRLLRLVRYPCLASVPLLAKWYCNVQNITTWQDICIGPIPVYTQRCTRWWIVGIIAYNDKITHTLWPKETHSIQSMFLTWLPGTHDVPILSMFLIPRCQTVLDESCLGCSALSSRPCVSWRTCSGTFRHSNSPFNHTS